jgi:tetratricopeptide (TPR) repeat protein
VPKVATSSNADSFPKVLENLRVCRRLYAEGTSVRKAGTAGRKIEGMPLFTRALALAAPLLLMPGPARTAAGNPASEALKTRASAELYNLNRAQAEATFREAIKADPQDAAAYRGLAGALWVGITLDRGAMTIDSYLGRVTRQDVKLPPPPQAVAAEFQESVDRAVALARGKLAAGRDLANAQYELGAAIGMRASYAATIEGSVVHGFRAAKEAYDAHERVLELDPARRDAGLIVGTYRYVVATLSMPLRWMAYIAGFGGGREKGIQLIEQAADYHGDNQVEAQLALTLLYNRERRYGDALRQLELLRARYPANRLLWLESGSTLLRAGRNAEAERVLSDGIARLAEDKRPRMFGEEALWYYKRGLARHSLGRAAEARTDLNAALAREGRNWVHGRTHFELGKLALQAGDRTAGREHLQAAIRLCESDRDAATADEAQRLLK